MNKRYENDSLGSRMKEYERTSQNFLMRRTPVIIRLDGKAFHTFTKRINKNNDPSLNDSPFSNKLHTVMTKVSELLCHNIQNAELAYTQSDEISLLLTDWNKLTTDQWFNANIQKIVSVSASLATAYFNKILHEEFPEINTLAFFDSRVFNLPKEEVTNYLIWRQNDCSRNSIQMLGHFYFSQNEMHHKSNSQVQDMLITKHGVNWNNIDDWTKRGTCIYKCHVMHDFVVDEEIPIFSKDRNYTEQHISYNEKDDND
ncbi:MAG: tRNA(His) guanylyltransferase Thg1 family protein [Nitrososphaeraceae archaeon]